MALRSTLPSGGNAHMLMSLRGGSMHPTFSIDLDVFDCHIRVLSNDGHAAEMLKTCNSAFVSDTSDREDTAIELRVLKSKDSPGWYVHHLERTEYCGSLADLLYSFDKTITIELQMRRQELFFLHAAAVSQSGRPLVIIGESGAGKSTLCWYLCNHGFEYISDELVPVDPQTMRILAYPRAICLKRRTVGMPALPPSTIRTSSTMHVPAESMPGGSNMDPCVAKVFVFLQQDQTAGSRLTEISRSEVAARIYANGLNQLAHAGDGLATAGELAGSVRGFVLARGPFNEMSVNVTRALRS